MAAQGSSGAGGPLLRVTDMLQDLADDSRSETFVKSTSSSLSPTASAGPTSTLTSESGLEQKDLPAAFQETYNELNVALTQSGHTWTGLTQELCATLTTADKLVATSQLNLGQLSQEVKKLEEIVEKGQEAVTRLQTAIREDRQQ